MDSEKAKRLVMVLLENLKNLEMELVAHRMLFLVASQMEVVPDLDPLLQLAKQRAALGMNQKYDDIAEKFQRIIDQVDFDQEVEEFLKSWNSEGPAN